MARSHICLGCGTDLARMRTPPDPYYGMPVVVCPRCELACLRRPHGGTARARSARRAALTAARITLRALLLTLVPSVLFAASAGIAGGLDSALAEAPVTSLFDLDVRGRMRLLGWWHSDGVWIVPVCLVGAIGLGFAVGMTFYHWRVKWATIGLATIVGSLLLLPPPLVAAVDHAELGMRFVEAWARNLVPLRELVLFGIPFLPAAAVSLAVMPAGQHVGRRFSLGRGLRSPLLKRARKRRRMK